MTCKDFVKNLTFYVYGELAADQRMALEAHLAACQNCRDELDKLRKINDLMNQRPVLEPAPELLVRSRISLNEALDREPAAWRALWREWVPTWATAHPAGAAGAVALIAFGFSLGWFLRARTPALPPQDAATNASLASTLVPDLGGARIKNITQVAPDPQTGAVRITLDAERRVTMEGSLDDPHIRQVLVYAVKSYDNPGIRLDTLEALGPAVNDPAIQEALLYDLGHDPNAGARLAALKAVGKMNWSPELRAALERVVERDPNAGVRDEAVDDLIEHGTARRDPELVPILKQLASRHSDAYVRLKSLAALRDMGVAPY